MGREQSPTEKMSKETLETTQHREHNSQEIVTCSSGPGQGSLVHGPHLPREQEHTSQVINLSSRHLFSHLPSWPPGEQAVCANSATCWNRGRTVCSHSPPSSCILAPAKPVPASTHALFPLPGMLLMAGSLSSFGPSLKRRFYRGVIPDHPKSPLCMPPIHLTVVFPSQDWALSETTWVLYYVPVCLPH